MIGLGVIFGNESSLFLVYHTVLLPPEDSHHQFSHFELLAEGVHYLPDSEPNHDLSRQNRVSVALFPRDPDSVGGIYGDVHVSHYQFPLSNLVFKYAGNHLDFEDVVDCRITLAGYLEKDHLSVQIDVAPLG